MKEFENKVEEIYLDMEEYFKIEEEYVNNETSLNENDYLDFFKLKYMKKKKYNKKIIEGNIDVTEYINNFIIKFSLVFPGLYKEEELRKVLTENIEIVNKSENNLDGIGGDYIYKDKRINIYIDTDEVKFHEAIHALRGNEEIENIDTLTGIIEAFTSYAEKLYTACSEQGFNLNYDQVKYYYNKNKKIKIKFSKSYNSLSLIAQELELIYNMINNTNTILKSFLKRENIYIMIKEIYEAYYTLTLENISIKELEYISMKSAYNLIVDIDNLHSIIMDELKDENILYAIRNIESQIKEILITLNINNESKYETVFNNISITEHIETKEERLLRMIFDEESEEVKYLKTLFSDDSNNNKRNYKK